MAGCGECEKCLKQHLLTARSPEMNRVVGKLHSQRVFSCSMSMSTVPVEPASDRLFSVSFTLLLITQLHNSIIFISLSFPFCRNFLSALVLSKFLPFSKALQMLMYFV